MSRFTCGGILTISAVLLLAAGHSPCRAAEPNPDTRPKTADDDPFRVPDGTVEELQKYLEGLKNLPPPSSLRPAGAEFRRKRAAAQLAAADKILTVKPTPASDVVRMALRAKVAALTTLERLGDATATAKIDATVQQAWQLVPPPPPPPPGVPPMLPPQNLPVPQGPPQLVLDVQFNILDGRAQGAAAMNGRQFAQLVDRLVAFLKQGPIDSDGARLAVDLGMAAEEHQKRDRAIATYTELGTLMAASSDEKVHSTSATLLGAARRLDLAGKPFVLQGSTLGGRAVDLKKYKGKVVLIDFFATWCGPCREEIPNISKCYRAYRKRGFEVVGVSLDRDRKTIADFLDKEKYPWTVLLDQYEARGTDKSLATYYGLFTIPQMILVGKDGRVLSIDVRGQRLNKALAEQFGPMNVGNGK
jgi:thiol-disulfide isomerase/thioredoxin